MDAIAFGCLTALFLSQIRLSLPVLRALCVLGAAILIFSLCFSLRAYSWGLGRNGLDMTILAIGTCMVIAAASQTQWQSPRLLTPLLRLGQRSYEVYLTHMFVVFAMFGIFTKLGSPIRAVPVLFASVILLAGIVGEAVARLYSDPMNRFLRRRSVDKAVRDSFA